MNVLYLANPTGAAREMADGVLGYIDTPRQGNRRPEGVRWAADNGCFGKGFDEQHWWKWLQRNAVDAGSCLFATAPDVVGDAQATLERSGPWLPKIRALGYRAALVAQDGLEDLVVPWDEFDALFIGGTTEWKLGPAVPGLISEAKARGKWVHCGRVNSRKRWRYMDHLGCDSVDGTYLVFGPKVNLPKLLRWVNQPSLWEAS